MLVCTFIIPTLGRPTLKRALDSLRAQTDPNWEAIVIGDGVEPDYGLRTWDGEVDMRIDMGKGPHQRSAGLTRNFGIMRAEMICSEAPKFIAFLDDDDHLSPRYVEHLREQAELHPEAEVIISRMKHPQLGVLPREDNVLALGRVGISFAVRWDVMQGARFIKEVVWKQQHEDWAMIAQLCTEGRKIHISPYIDYYVRDATCA